MTDTSDNKAEGKTKAAAASAAPKESKPKAATKPKAKTAAKPKTATKPKAKAAAKKPAAKKTAASAAKPAASTAAKTAAETTAQTTTTTQSAPQDATQNTPQGATTATDTPKIPMLPPSLVLLHVAAGLTLGWMIPLSLSHSWGYIGLLLVGGAIGVIYKSKQTLESAGTNLAPNLPVTKLVKDGPYAYSRNPVYLAFLVGFAGLALLAGSFTMLLVTGSLYYFLRHKIIAAEEAYLEEKFGNSYREYTMKVHRWIMFSK